MPEKKRKIVNVEDGNEMDALQAVISWLTEVIQLFAGGKAIVTVERPTRSLRQNRYYFGCILERIRQGLLDAGHAFAVEDLHEHFATKYMPVEVSEWTDLDTGEVKTKRERKSTSDLDSTEFSRYIERIKQDEVVLQLGIHIPSPDEPPIEAYE